MHHMGSHDVGLMDCSDFTSFVPGSIIKCIFSNPAGFLFGDYLKTLHHTRNTLDSKSKIPINTRNPT